MGKGKSGLNSGNATLSKVDKTGFTNEGGGVYSLDIEGAGGGQILDVSDNYNYGGTAYEARAWDSNYKAIGEMQVYSSLNAAKTAIKDKIKSSIK